MEKTTLQVRCCPCCGAPLGAAEADRCEYCGAVFTEEQKTQSRWLVNARQLALLTDTVYKTYNIEFFARAQLELSPADYEMQRQRVVAESKRRLDLRMKNRFPWIIGAILCFVFSGFFGYHLIMGVAYLFAFAFFGCLIACAMQNGRIDEDDAEEIGDFLPPELEKAEKKNALQGFIWIGAAIVVGFFTNCAIDGGLRTLGIIGIVATAACIVVAVIQIARNRK